MEQTWPFNIVDNLNLLKVIIKISFTIETSIYGHFSESWSNVNAYESSVFIFVEFGFTAVNNPKQLALA